MKPEFRPYAGHPPRSACTGCAGQLEHRGFVIARPGGAALGAICDACAARALTDPKHRKALAICAVFEVHLPLFERLFIRRGVFDFPQSAEEIDEALGLPAGTVRGVVGDL